MQVVQLLNNSHLFGFFYVPFPLILFIPICKSNFPFHRFYSALCILLIIPSLLIPSSLAFVLLSNFNRNSHLLSFIFLDSIHVLEPQTEIKLFIFGVFHVLLVSYEREKRIYRRMGLLAIGMLVISLFIVYLQIFLVNLFFFHGCDFAFSL